MALPVTHPEAGELPLLGSPFVYSRSGGPKAVPPPMLSEHTVNVLAEVLGWKEAEIAALAEEAKRDAAA